LEGVGSIAQSSAVVNNGWFDIAGTNAGASIHSLAGSGFVSLGDQTLTLTHAADTYSGSIYGYDLSGLVLAGGSETLSGFGFVGNTLIQQGTLAVNGLLFSPVTVEAPGTLRGTGMVYGPITVNGTLAPGNSPGTLTTIGTVTMNSGSVFKSEIDGTGTGNGAGNYSRLVVIGEGNQFIVNGASLNTVFRGIGGNANNNYTPQLGEKFNIVTAEGGIVGRFANNSLTGLNGNTRLDAFYNVGGNNTIELISTPNSYDGFMALTGSNGNARSVGGALDRMRVKNDMGWTTPRQDQLLYSVANLNAVQLPTVATALAGEVHGAIAAAAPDAGRWLQTALARQLSTAAREGEEVGIKPGDNLWFDFNASQGRTDGDSYASSYGYSRYQFAIGGDVLHSQANRFGLGVTYASTSVAPNTGSGKFYETAPFIYGQYALGKEKKVYIDGLFAYGFTEWQTERANPLYTTGPLKTNASGSNIAWGVGVRSPFEFESFTVEPFLRVLWQNSNRGSANEGFASPSALGLGNYSQNGTRLLVGAAFGSAKHDPLATCLTYRASVAFGNDFGELIRPYVQANLAGESFQIASPHVGRQFAQLNLSGTYRVIDNTYAYIGLNGEARENRLDGSVNAGVNFKF
jgi:outer membrane autotransporter protein